MFFQRYGILTRGHVEIDQKARSCPVDSALFSTLLGRVPIPSTSTDQKRRTLFSHGHWASEGPE